VIISERCPWTLLYLLSMRFSTSVTKWR